jgi:hypothetical protein
MSRLVRWDNRRGMGNLFEITNQSINAIEQYIRWAEVEVPNNMNFHLDRLAHHMALMDQGFSRKMSFGPYDPSGRKMELAWRTPEQGIRRISQAYYLGWKLKKLRPGHYRVYNNTKEAYFIEFGISQVGFGENRHVPRRRIRRPVRKLALIKTMRFMMTTQAYHRVWTDIFRARHTYGGFTQKVQSPGGGHMRWENVSQHEAGSVARGNVFHGRQMMTGLRHQGGNWQRRVPNKGGGSYTGPHRPRWKQWGTGGLPK